MYQKRLPSLVIISHQENALNAFLIYWPWWWLHGFAHFVTIYKDAYLALFYIFVIFQLKHYLKKFFFHLKRLSTAFGPFQGKKWRSPHHAARVLTYLSHVGVQTSNAESPWFFLVGFWLFSCKYVASMGQKPPQILRRVIYTGSPQEAQLTADFSQSPCCLNSEAKGLAFSSGSARLISFLQAL